jgi:hypothetical protein
VWSGWECPITNASNIHLTLVLARKRSSATKNIRLYKWYQPWRGRKGSKTLCTSVYANQKAQTLFDIYLCRSRFQWSCCYLAQTALPCLLKGISILKGIPFFSTLKRTPTCYYWWQYRNPIIRFQRAPKRFWNTLANVLRGSSWPSIRSLFSNVHEEDGVNASTSWRKSPVLNNNFVSTSYSSCCRQRIGIDYDDQFMLKSTWEYQQKEDIKSIVALH